MTSLNSEQSNIPADEPTWLLLASRLRWTTISLVAGKKEKREKKRKGKETEKGECKVGMERSDGIGKIDDMWLYWYQRL